MEQTQKKAKKGYLATFSEHLSTFKGLYTVIITLSGIVWGTAIALGQNWLVGQIDQRIDLKLKSVKDEISQIRKEVRCEAIDNRIGAYRTELRSVETELFRAQQDGNTALIIRLRERQGMINDALADEIERRSELSCTTLP